jgi:hypothetical protein
MNAIIAVIFAPLALLAVLFMVGAFFLTLHRRRERAWAMQNQVYTGTPTSRRQVVLPNVSAFTGASGVLGVIGQAIDGVAGMPFVTLDYYQTQVSGCTALFNGTFNLSVIGRLANSPLVTHVIKPGDRLYLNGATYDSTTNVWYGGSIDANPAGIEIGVLDPSYTGTVAAGVTATVPVNISTKGGM